MAHGTYRAPRQTRRKKTVSLTNSFQVTETRNGNNCVDVDQRNTVYWCPRRFSVSSATQVRATSVRHCYWFAQGWMRLRTGANPRGSSNFSKIMHRSPRWTNGYHSWLPRRRPGFDSCAGSQQFSDWMELALVWRLQSEFVPPRVGRVARENCNVLYVAAVHCLCCVTCTACCKVHLKLAKQMIGVSIK